MSRLTLVRISWCPGDTRRLTVVYADRLLELEAAGLVPAEGRADASIVLRRRATARFSSPARPGPRRSTGSRSRIRCNSGGTCVTSAARTARKPPTDSGGRSSPRRSRSPRERTPARHACESLGRNGRRVHRDRRRRRRDGGGRRDRRLPLDRRGGGPAPHPATRTGPSAASNWRRRLRCAALPTQGGGARSRDRGARLRARSRATVGSDASTIDGSPLSICSSLRTRRGLDTPNESATS